MLKKTFFVLLLTLWCVSAPSIAQQTQAPLALMPWPQTLSLSEHSLTLKSLPTIALNGPHSDTLKKAVQRFSQQLKKQTGLSQSEKSVVLAITIERDISPVNSADLLNTEEEAYQLRIESNGIELSAETSTGAMLGLQTLLQLAGTVQPVTLPGVRIDDQPRFAWRGLLLDSVRHFFSVDTVKRQIDGMAAAKLNVLHWHLTDDQGWRFPSKAYPKLQQSNQDGLYYTRAQIKDVVAYAQARGIHVLPEIDMPGHASAIAIAYPELMSAPGPYPHEDRWGVHKPLLNPANPEVYTFAEKILSEVTELFPFPYVHVGGDEVDPEHWQANEQINEFRQQHNLADSHALHAYFNKRLAEILGRLNRKMIGWDEVLHPDLPSGTVVQSWQGPDALGRAINMGYPALLSTGFYLDQPQYASYHHRVRFVPQPIRFKTAPDDDEPWSSWEFTAPRKRGSDISGTVTVLGEGESLRGFIDFKNKSRQALRNLSYTNHNLNFEVDTWMGPVTARLNSQKNALSGLLITGNAPYQVSGSKIAGHSVKGSAVPTAVAKDLVSDGNKSLLLGGEAALWTEIVDENSIDLRLWPRGFVVAERLWSPENVRDESFMYQRLNMISQWAEESAGLQHVAQQTAALQKRYPHIPAQALLTLSSAMEPAHYYHRHHEKSVNETYSRRDPLDRFVDSLPNESSAVRRFRKDINAWLQEVDNKTLQERIVGQLKAWCRAAQTVQAADIADYQELNQLSQNLLDVSEIGLQEVERIAENKPSAAGDMPQQIDRALSIQHEVIVAAAFGVRTLRNHP